MSNKNAFQYIGFTIKKYDTFFDSVRNFGRKAAFTLAEVLIVLGIIGVVAEMTIPTLMHNTQNQVLKAQFTKMYSTINQAVMMTKVDLGVDNLNSAYVNYNGTEYVNASEYINSFYKQLRISGTKDYSTSPKNFTNSTNAYWYAIGWEAPDQLLPDGSSIYCMINAGMINISVDVNGPNKKPNKAGYDIFGFYIDSNDTVQPYNPASWVWGSYAICTSSSSANTNGLGCSYYALQDKNPDDSTKDYWTTLK